MKLSVGHRLELEQASAHGLADLLVGLVQELSATRRELDVRRSMLRIVLDRLRVVLHERDAARRRTPSPSSRKCAPCGEIRRRNGIKGIICGSVAGDRRPDSRSG